VKNNALERALHESEERYRFIIENFNGIAFERKPDLSVIFCHGAIEPITGYTSEEINGKEISWDILVHHEDLPMLYDAMKDAEKDPALSTDVEYRIITKDGEEHWVQEFAHYLRKKSGRIYAVQGTIYDITERRQMVDQLIAQRDLGLGLAATRSLDTALELCLSTACKVAGMSFGALYLENPHTERFEVARYTGFSESFVDSIRTFEKSAPICRTVAKGECIYSFFDEMKDFLGCEVSNARVQVVLVIPIVYNTSSIGFLLLGSNYPEEISDSSLMSLEVIAFQAGNAIARIWVEEMLAEGERSSGWGDEIRSRTRVE
jgi:PAS domain S-box-containing protein